MLKATNYQTASSIPKVPMHFPVVKSKLIVCLAAFMIVLQVNAQQWSWGNQSKYPGAGNIQGVTSVDVDQYGNVYAVGNAKDYNFGCGADTGAYEGFLSKFDANGNCLWNQRIKCSGKVNITTVRADYSNHVLICGSYVGTMAVDTTSLPNRTYRPGRFLMKLDSAGHSLWAKYDTLVTYSQWNDMEIDKGDTIYLVGTFSDSLLNYYPPGSRANLEVLVKILKPDGSFKFSADSYNYMDTATYMLGLDIELVPPNHMVCRTIANGYHEMFGGPISGVYARLIPKPVLIYFYNRMFPSYKVLDCPVQDRHHTEGGLTTDSVGRLYVLGYTNDTCTIDTSSFIPATNVQQQAYVTKIAFRDTVMWLRKFEKADSCVGVDISYHGKGRLHMVGTFSDSVAYDGNMVTGSSGRNSFFLDIDTTGKAICLTEEDGIIPAEIATHTGYNYYAGSFQGTVLLSGKTLSTSNTSEILVGKYKSCNQIPTAIDPLKTGTMVVYPNPANGKIRLLSSKPVKTLQICSIDGKSMAVQRVRSGGSDVLINTVQYPPGVYIMSVSTNIAVQRIKVMIQH